MSVATLTGAGGSRREPFVDETGPRPAFGRRVVPRQTSRDGQQPNMPVYSMHVEVSDLRRRIDTVEPEPARRLPLVLCALVIVSLSLILWYNFFMLAGFAVRQLSGLF